MKLVNMVSAALALAWPVTAQAVAQIDVDNLIVGEASQGRPAVTGDIGGLVQTWTAGISGRLTQIDMFTGAYYNLPANAPVPDPSERAVLDIFDARNFVTTLATSLSANINNATFLGSVSLPLNSRPNGSQISSVQTFMLDQINIMVEHGQPLAFRMRVDCSPCNATASLWVNWTSVVGGLTSHGYNGGEFLFTSNSYPLYFSSGTQNLDLNFRTWVDASFANAPDPGFVPEPASWAMLIIGFGLVGAAARGRRRDLMIGTRS